MSTIRSLLACPLMALAVAFPRALGAEESSTDPLKIASWQAPSADEVRKEALAWLDGHKVDSATRRKAEEIWSAKPEHPAGVEVLERLIRTFALGDDNARKLSELCAKPKTANSPPKQPWLADAKTPALEAKNLRLWYGRWLVQERLYDEALEQFDGLRPEDVVDPASLLFYQGVVYHRLLSQEAGLETLERLLEKPEAGPRRYATLARLMESDLEKLKEDSLDHISRRMEDIERRLDLGRAGPKVREIQEGVVKSLDKLIEELEAQQRQQQQSMSGGNNLQPQQAAPDSTPMGGKGPGQVAKRNVGSESGWGNLPPKQREEAMQQVGRDFPSHYRDVIEQYFRKLATEGSE
jgi:hypothetical protein